jgi:hypothetical protein
LFDIFDFSLIDDRSILSFCYLFVLSYSKIGDILYAEKGCIYNKGNWAKIIEQPKEMTIEQIEKELGYKVKIIS